MNSPSEDIKNFLVNAGLGLTFASNLFIGKEPATPDNCVTIFDTPGASPEVFYDKTQNLDYPAIQIRVRNKSYIAGWNLINNIKEVLHNIGNTIIGDSEYLLIQCSQEPALLEWDDSNRVKLVISFDLIRTKI